MNSYLTLLDRIVEWAKQDGNVVALIQTGSGVQATAKFDEFSDLDIEIIARNYGSLAQDDAWLRSFGEVWAKEYLSDGQEYPTRLVFYEDAVKVDFTLADKKRLDSMLETGKLNQLYARGFKVVLDKEGLANNLGQLDSAVRQSLLPSKDDFAAVVDEFWFEAAHMPKYLIRGDLWVVKFRDWTMKEMLLKMLEWYALSVDEGQVDVRWIGNKMHEWVDVATWNELQNVYGHFDVLDSWRALAASAKLFQRLTHGVSERLGLDYSKQSEEKVWGYLQSMEKRVVSSVRG